MPTPVLLILMPIMTNVNDSNALSTAPLLGSAGASHSDPVRASQSPRATGTGTGGRGGLIYSPISDSEVGGDNENVYSDYSDGEGTVETGARDRSPSPQSRAPLGGRPVRLPPGLALDDFVAPRFPLVVEAKGSCSPAVRPSEVNAELSHEPAAGRSGRLCGTSPPLSG